MSGLTDPRDVVDVVIGVDTHVHTHSAAALDARTGGVLDEITVEATTDGYDRRRRDHQVAHPFGVRAGQPVAALVEVDEAPARAPAGQPGRSGDECRVRGMRGAQPAARWTAAVPFHHVAVTKSPASRLDRPAINVVDPKHHLLRINHVVAPGPRAGRTGRDGGGLQPPGG